ncbi:DUF1206 domain-containing protein [Hymenobacter sp. 15J16-1T3B]|uniref:DUF1206 domain-containing protein n=1 Tax=Hymenobacter sp. 15J16-1T3B TaxID=2886941 RepID=UPI001D10214D|nr:DUF1206 domain-containing protein [Hymenobacter sp. 15J16-1T3B]MCC3156527.1 DUF1206 domain-containing protein [Hymenobacter sp. 15J16-1T3B]
MLPLPDLDLPSPARAFTVLARFGLAAQGVVHLLLGALAAQAAAGVRAARADREQALLTIEHLPLGPWLLGLLALSLGAYVTWRFVQAAFNTERCGYDAKGLGKRVFFACSAVGYGWLAYYAMHLAVAGRSTGDSQQHLIATALSYAYGHWLLGAVALTVMGIALFQLYQAFAGTMDREVNDRRLPDQPWQLVYRLGQVGYTARGVVWLILAYYLLLAAVHGNAREARDTDGAFDILGRMGSGVLLVVAAGFVCYGLYMLVRARYPRMQGPA